MGASLDDQGLTLPVHSRRQHPLAVRPPAVPKEPTLALAAAILRALGQCPAV